MGWDKIHEKVFEEIISCLTYTPVLVFADLSKPFILYMDVSLDSLGVVQYQEAEGKWKPVAFAS